MNESLHILVVDDDHSMAKTLVNILQVKGFQAEVTHSAQEALKKVAETAFDCVLSDIKMPEINGGELYRAIKAQRPDMPVVLMTAYSSDSLVEEGLEEGAIAALTKPLDIDLVLTFFTFLRQERSVVIVDDDRQFCRTLGDTLRARGFAVTQITDPYDAVAQIGTNGQVVLLDMKLNGINGLEVLKEIRERHPRVPVILVTGYRKEMAAATEAALEIDAYTCLYKPFGIGELLEVLTEVRRRELRRMLAT